MQQNCRYFGGNKLLQGFVIWAKQLFKYTVSVSLEFFQICNFSHILTLMSEITITCRWGRFILLKPLKSYRQTKEKIMIVRHFSLEMMSNPYQKSDIYVKNANLKKKILIYLMNTWERHIKYTSIICVSLQVLQKELSKCTKQIVIQHDFYHCIWNQYIECWEYSSCCCCSVTLFPLPSLRQLDLLGLLYLYLWYIGVH